MMRMKIWILAIPALLLSSLFCAVQVDMGDTATPGLDVGEVVKQTMEALTAHAPTVGVPEPVGTSSPGASMGQITGHLSYPSEAVPPLHIVAFRLESGTHFSVDTTLNQGTYEINVPPGTYNVIAYTIGGGGFPAGLPGGYTQMVPCGFTVSCTDHTLIDVPVLAGQTVTGINPGDWYGVSNAFPPNPDAAAVPPAPQTGSIAGNLFYPSEGIPPLIVVAFRVGGAPNEYYSVTTLQNQGTYQIDDLPPGSYHVVAYPQTGGGGLAGGYSQMVPCGLSVNCTDHSLIEVIVNPGQVTQGANPADWYAPDGAFPPMPNP
jgi:hypothetical protein